MCELDDARRVGLRQEWTDRGPEPAEARVSAETLAELRAIADAITTGMVSEDRVTDDSGE